MKLIILSLFIVILASCGGGSGGSSSSPTIPETSSSSGATLPSSNTSTGSSASTSPTTSNTTSSSATSSYNPNLPTSGAISLSGVFETDKLTYEESPEFADQYGLGLINASSAYARVMVKLLPVKQSKHFEKMLQQNFTEVTLLEKRNFLKSKKKERKE